ncbi:MAG: hypothetical protein ACREA9_21080 [Pyrinomonadaceae bacterium]
MKTNTQKFPLPAVAFNFAGFTWPRYLAQLPRGTMVQRLARRNAPGGCGPYYLAPKPVTYECDSRGFYLDSDGMPQMRWTWCDEVEGVRIDHTGWFTDENGDWDKIRGLVFRLPRSRGFLAAWSMGESMASGLDVDIYDDEQDAARAANDLAEFVADQERENALNSDDDDDDDDSGEPYDEIKRGMELAFFGSAYADQADECDQPMRGEIMDQLPDTIDPAAVHAAKTLEADLINANRGNGCATLTELYRYAESLPADGSDRELSPELFGHYLAMQGMGTGVGLESFGYAVRDSINVPYCEFGSHSLENDYFESDDDSEGE